MGAHRSRAEDGASHSRLTPRRLRTPLSYQRHSNHRVLCQSLNFRSRFHIAKGPAEGLGEDKAAGDGLTGRGLPLSRPVSPLVFAPEA